MTHSNSTMAARLAAISKENESTSSIDSTASDFFDSSNAYSNDYRSSHGAMKDLPTPPHTIDDANVAGIPVRRRTSSVSDSDFNVLGSTTLKDLLKLPVPKYKKEPWIHSLTVRFYGSTIC